LEVFSAHRQPLAVRGRTGKEEKVLGEAKYYFESQRPFGFAPQAS